MNAPNCSTAWRTKMTRDQLKHAIRAAVVHLACKYVTAGEAFHLSFVTSGDFILGIIAQQEISADRIGYVHRIESSFEVLVRYSTFSVLNFVRLVIAVVILVVPVHTTLYKKIAISDRKQIPSQFLASVNTEANRSEPYFFISIPFPRFGSRGGQYRASHGTLRPG